MRIPPEGAPLHDISRRISRRALLAGGLAAAGTAALAACSARPDPARPLPPSASRLAPAPGGRVVTSELVARPTTIDLGGPTVRTWAYGDTLPGPLVRARAGDLLRVRVTNSLETDTSIHWHGIALRNAADGVPGLTQQSVAPGDAFDYAFVVPHPGTYFYHPHVGVQLDRGLYAPMIVDDPDEPGAYDSEWILVLDDWVDGTGRTPDDVFAEFTGGTGMSGHEGHGMPGMDGGDADDGEAGAPGPEMPGHDMSGHGGHDMSGMGAGSPGNPFGDAGDVVYPHYLVNGRVPTAPDVHHAKPGQRVRLRIINAGADTIFAVALGDHRLTVTDTDGFPVRATTVDGLYIGMGERYDCVVTLKDGVFPFVAKPVGKKGQARALIRTGAGEPPKPGYTPAELGGKVVSAADLRPAESALLPARDVGQEITLDLTGQMSPYEWGFNGVPYARSTPFEIEPDERVRIRLRNATMMAHPMHLHGHTFALPNGLRKDTVLLTPMQRLDIEFQADNPGDWMAHCHNIYHAEAGMMASLTYRT